MSTEPISQTAALDWSTWDRQDLIERQDHFSAWHQPDYANLDDHPFQWMAYMANKAQDVAAINSRFHENVWQQNEIWNIEDFLIQNNILDERFIHSWHRRQPEDYRGVGWAIANEYEYNELKDIEDRYLGTDFTDQEIGTAGHSVNFFDLDQQSSAWNLYDANVFQRENIKYIADALSTVDWSQFSEGDQVISELNIDPFKDIGDWVGADDKWGDFADLGSDYMRPDDFDPKTLTETQGIAGQINWHQQLRINNINDFLGNIGIKAREQDILDDIEEIQEENNEAWEQLEEDAEVSTGSSLDNFTETFPDYGYNEEIDRILNNTDITTAQKEAFKEELENLSEIGLSSSQVKRLIGESVSSFSKPLEQYDPEYEKAISEAQDKGLDSFEFKDETYSTPRTDEEAIEGFQRGVKDSDAELVRRLLLSEVLKSSQKSGVYKILTDIIDETHPESPYINVGNELAALLDRAETEKVTEDLDDYIDNWEYEPYAGEVSHGTEVIDPGPNAGDPINWDIITSTYSDEELMDFLTTELGVITEDQWLANTTDNSLEEVQGWSQEEKDAAWEKLSLNTASESGWISSETLEGHKETWKEDAKQETIQAQLDKFNTDYGLNIDINEWKKYTSAQKNLIADIATFNEANPDANLPLYETTREELDNKIRFKNREGFYSADDYDTLQDSYQNLEGNYGNLAKNYDALDWKHKAFQESVAKEGERRRTSESYGTMGAPLNEEVQSVRMAGSSSTPLSIMGRGTRGAFNRKGLRIKNLNI